jgi:thiol-disulfide isomerase/thioredoxin
MKKSGLYLLAGLFALACGIFAKQMWTSFENTQPAPMPTFSLPDLAGKQRSSDEWQGKIRVINFWATWCPPCRKEIPQFMALQTELAGQGVVFLGVAIDDEKAVKNYNEDLLINYPLLIATDAGVALARQFGDVMDAVPYTVIVNQQGQIVYRQPGEVTKEQLMSVISPLLKV